jgi:hypothetical protein
MVCKRAMQALTEDQLAEVWQRVHDSTASMRRREMKREEERDGEMEDLIYDARLEKMKKLRERRRMIDNAPPANRPDLVGMKRVTDDVMQRRRDERVEAADNAAAEAVRKDPGFVPYDPRPIPKHSAALDPRLVYVPKNATVIDKTPPEKKSWWSRGGGAGTTASHVALAAVVVVSAIIGSFQASV